MSREIGRIIGDARRAQGFSQARLAGLAGISRRQLASIESGANTSIRVLGRLAEVLRIPEIPLGASVAGVGGPFGVDPSVLADRVAGTEFSLREAGAAMSYVRSAIETYAGRPRTDAIADRPLDEDEGRIGVPLLAELSSGTPLAWSAELEMIPVDLSRIDTGEALVRLRGAAVEGLHDGDLLVVELRPAGNAATGELVIALVEGTAWLGRWWNKRGRRLLHGARTGRVVREIAAAEAVVIFGAVTDVVRSTPLAVRRKR